MSNSSIKMGVKGRYSLSVLDKNGKIKKEKSINNTSNAVTYNGAYVSFCFSGLFDTYYAAIGTGTTEITRSSASLNNEDSGRTSGQSATRAGNEVDNEDGTSTLTLSRTFSFSLGEKVGTFSEVGLYNSSASGTFIAGQLIKDEFGAPTTITILSDEQLVITYILEWVYPNASQLAGSGTVTDNASNTYNYEIYTQPYFGIYTINNSNPTSRYIGNASFDEVGFFAADGVTSLYNTNSLGNGFVGKITHDGSGTVTYTTAAELFSPASSSFTALTYLSFYTFNSDVAADSGVLNTTTNIGYVNSTSAFPMLIKFLNPIDKTTSQSFGITASFTVTL